MIVFDCSALAGVIFEDEKDLVAEGLLRKAVEDGFNIIVPSLFVCEFNNVLVKCLRRGRITEDDVRQYIEKIQRLYLTVDSLSSQLEYMEKVAYLAIKHGLTSYDATYLELATRKECPIATLDKQLYKAANSLGLAYQSGTSIELV